MQVCIYKSEENCKLKETLCDESECKDRAIQVGEQMISKPIIKKTKEKVTE